MTADPQAFILMPFDAEFNGIYSELIRPPLEDAGFEVVRADSFAQQRNILKDIVRGITTAKLVVADLTGFNPNVMYELGICHGLDVPTILIAQSIEDVPFDLQSYRVQVYSTHFDQIGKLKEALADIASRHLKGEVAFGNPVSDFRERGVDEARRAVAIHGLAKPEEQDTEAEEERGWLDYLMESESRMTHITSILHDVGEATRDLGSHIEMHAAKLGTIQEQPGPGTAGLIYKITTEAAEDARRFATEVQPVLSEYDGDINWLVEALDKYLAFFGDEPEDERVYALRETITSMNDAAVGSVNAMKGFRAQVSSILGISKQMNASFRHVMRVLDQYISTTEKLNAFCVRAIGLMDETQ